MSDLKPAPLDDLINNVQSALQTIFPPTQRPSARPIPGAALKNSVLSDSEENHIAGLMRVNHSGEVCAQALYQGQALTAKLPQVREQMQHCAEEEIDHLAWCESRLRELNSQPSRLNVLWYAGSFTLGAIAGWAGDKWSLGFVAETENQVAQHLQSHLESIPSHDKKTLKIIRQMQADEQHHAQEAQQAGAQELPFVIKTAMRYMAKLMTATTYRL